MGTIKHWVTRFEPSKIAAAVIYAASMVASAAIIAGAMKPDDLSVTLNIENAPGKPVQSAFKLDRRTGELIPITLTGKK